MFTSLFKDWPCSATKIILEQLEERIVLDGAVDDISFRADLLSVQFVDVDSVTDSDVSDAVSTDTLIGIESLALETGSETLPDGTWHYWERDWGADGNGYEFHAWQDGSSSFHQVQWDAKANSKGTHNGFDYNIQSDSSWTYQAVQWDADENGYSYDATSTGIFTYDSAQWSGGMGYSYQTHWYNNWMYHVRQAGTEPGDVVEYEADSGGFYNYTYTWANGASWTESSGNEPYEPYELLRSHTIKGLTDVDGTLYFTTTLMDNKSGAELWKTDGTAVGTVMVKDIMPGSGSSDPTLLKNVNGTLFFVANDGINGLELWKSDGTTAGTVMVKDIKPGVGSSMEKEGSGIPSLTNVDGIVYFRADDGVHGKELWKSDGTSEGTVMVKDIRPGSDSSSPNYLTEVNGALYFAGNDGIHGSELWKSDGTAEGTVMVRELSVGAAGGIGTAEFINVNGTLFFEADGGHELWKTDGTAAGTVMVKDFGAYGFGNLTNVSGSLYFSGEDPNGNIYGAELWKSNGTDTGTFMVKDIRPGLKIGSDPRQLTSVNGNLFFVANDGVHYYELWTSDGTEAGTHMVKELHTNDSGVPNYYLTDVNGTLFFSADDHDLGAALWKSNGTDSGTEKVSVVQYPLNIGKPTDLTYSNEMLYFTAERAWGGGDWGSHLWVVHLPSET